MTNQIYDKHLLVWTVLLLTAIGQVACSPDERTAILIKSERQYLGDYLCSGGHKGIDIHGNKVHMLMNHACHHGTGVGEDLYYWTMEYGSDQQGTLLQVSI